MKLHAAKGKFFDREAVQKRLDAGVKKSLSKIGAFVRTDASRSIRSVGKRAKAKALAARMAGQKEGTSVVSKPGSPPLSHTGLLKKNIFFVYDDAIKSVVVGPILLNAKSGGKAPRLLEHGGTDQRKTKKSTVVAVYQPRPFMGPALDRTRDKIPETFKSIL